MTLVIKPLTRAIGAVIEGVKLDKPLTDHSLRALEAALIEHQVLFFRDQQITPREQRAFAARFGDLHIHPIYPKHEEVPEIMVLDTAVFDLRDNAIWHTDVTFIQTPPLGSILAARVLPETGGDTLWSSGIAAYEALSPPFQRFLNGLTAAHNFAKSFPAERYGTREEDRAKLETTRRTHPPVTHPVIRTHPVSKRKAVFVNEGFTTHINELADAESQAVLSLLFAHVTKPEFTIRWQWREGDVAFWDNRVTQHYAVNDYSPARRVMHRATILGDQPA